MRKIKKYGKKCNVTHYYQTYVGSFEKDRIEYKIATNSDLCLVEVCGVVTPLL